MSKKNRDRMPDFAFRMMSAVMVLEDWLFPHLDKRIAGFDIREGMTVVDYGCGPGRYTVRFSKLVGEAGKVYAVDVQALALQYVGQKMEAQGLKNILPVLADGYQTDIPNHSADMAFALDMFFGVSDPVALLAELHRIVRPEGILILDDGHQSRERTFEKLGWSGKWEVVQASQDHLRCSPR